MHVHRDPINMVSILSNYTENLTRTMTVNGGYLMRLVIPLPGPDGQMRPPALPNFIDLYLQQLEQILSHRRVRERLGVGVHPTAPQSASDSE